MANYILTYYGGAMPKSPEEGEEFMAKWNVWAETLGDALVNPGKPLGKSKIVGSDGVSDYDGSNPMSGFSIVQADSMDSAVQMASDCPHILLGGTMGVAEMMEM